MLNILGKRLRGNGKLYAWRPIERVDGAIATHQNP